MGNKKHQIVIVGGGTGGVMVAAQLKRAKSSLDIAIIDPTDTHIYQPANTLVGAGLMDYEDTLKPELFSGLVIPMHFFPILFCIFFICLK